MPLRAIWVALAVACSIAGAQSSFAWDGVDSQTGQSVEIGRGNLVRSGSDIEIYDYGTGEHRDVEVQSIRRSGGSVEVEVYDYGTGEYRTLEMDD